MKKTLGILLGLAISAGAQVSNPSIQYRATSPVGICTGSSPQVNLTDGSGEICTCQSSSYACAVPGGGGGSGTVTNTSGALTLNSLMAGAGTNDSKVLAADPGNCSVAQAATGIDKTGNAKGCFTPATTPPCYIYFDGTGANGILQNGATTAGGDAPVEQCPNGTGASRTVSQIRCIADVAGTTTVQFTQGIQGGTLLASALTVANGKGSAMNAGSLSGTPANLVQADGDYFNTSETADSVQHHMTCVIKF